MCSKVKRAVIFSGGTLGPWALSEILEEDLLIGVDRGALFLIQNGLGPHISLGDFDSTTPEEVELIRQGSEQFQDWDPVDKDWTDTELALNWALQQNPREILIIGALGTRFDHTLANVHLLVKAHRHNIQCSIIDKHNKITLIETYGQIQRNRYTYVSLLPLSTKATGVTLEGFQYPLHNATFSLGETIGVSNVLIADTGHIHVATGQLLCIQSID